MTKLVMLNVRIEKDLKKKFKQYALDHDIGMSELILVYVEELVANG